MSDQSSEPTLRLLARHTPPGWDDPPPCCIQEHNWGPWRAHPNGVNDVRSCKNSSADEAGNQRDCSWSDWREHTHWWGDVDRAGRRRCRMIGCSAADLKWR